MKPVAIRGATTVNNNDADEIKSACVEMMTKLVEANSINPDDITMCFVTMTKDLTAFNASAAIRTGLDWSQVPFFTSLEPDVDGSLERCIRVLVQVGADIDKSAVKHIYLGEAAKLRPDLSAKS